MIKVVDMRIENSTLSLEESKLYEDFATTQLEELNHNMTRAVLPVTIFIGLECGIGLFGNILILLVYSSRYEKSNFRYFVISMAAVDLTSCLTTLPGEIFSQMNWYTYEHAWICKVKSYFNILTVWASASILFGLAFDRYRKVCHPLAWQLRQSMALRCCVVSVATAAVVASPVIILWGRQDYVYVDGALTLNVSVCEKSGPYANEIYPLLYISCVYILPIGIMLLIVCILNVLTAKKLFCGMSIWRKRYKGTPVSTKQSVLSTVSLGNIVPGIETTGSDPTRSHTTKNTEFNTRCTNIAIWIDTDVHDNDRVSDSRSETKTIDPRASKAPCVNGKSLSDRDITTNAYVVANHEDVGESSANELSVTTISDSFNTEPSRPHFSLTGELSANSTSTDSSRSTLTAKDSGQLDTPELKIKRKTIIMLVLTSVFVVTMVMYLVMVSLVADSEGLLKNLSNSEKVWFFLFWRMYFINCLVNPILYGFLDPRFRSGLKGFFKKKQTTHQLFPRT